MRLLILHLRRNIWNAQIEGGRIETGISGKFRGHRGNGKEGWGGEKCHQKGRLLVNDSEKFPGKSGGIGGKKGGK